MMRLMIVRLMIVRAVDYDDEDHQSSTSCKPSVWSTRNFARELDQEPIMISRNAMVMMLMNMMLIIGITIMMLIDNYHLTIVIVV